MPTKMTGDFSNYPEDLRDVMPYLQGEVCELRAHWQTFHYLFMADGERTKLFGKHLGGLLGTFQSLLQDEMLVSIARLTDLDSRGQKNLGFWSLVERCERWNTDFAQKIRAEVKALATEASSIRTHRHKRLAHFDFPTSVGQSTLPIVTFDRVLSVIKRCEGILNLVLQKAENSTMMFEFLDHRDIVGVAAISVYKAEAYDAAVASGKIELLEWRRFISDKN